MDGFSRRTLLTGLGLGLFSMPFVGRATVPTPVDVELVLAADGSGSIDDDELAFQRDGYARAITSREVLTAISSGIIGQIALAYLEWGGPSSQVVIVDWMVINNAESAQMFASLLRTRPRGAYGYNSISAAIDVGVRMVEENSFQGLRRVIDVSGDGPNIGGRPVQFARNDAVDKGFTINALAIQRAGGAVRAPGGMPLADHYRNDVIGGPGAFVEIAESRETFAETVRRKMVLEIAGLPQAEVLA